MNIFLADVQSLKVNLSEPVQQAAPDSDSFNNLMDQNLNQDAELSTQVEYPQVIDSKEVLYNDEALSEAGGLSLQGFDTPQAWLEYLANQKLNMTTEAPAESISVDMIRIENSIQIENPEEFDQIVLPVIGAVLPANGKTLPVSDIRLDGQALALSAQENLLRQNRSMFIGPSKQVSAETDILAARQSSDIRSVDLASISSAFEIPGLVKADSSLEKINIARGLEFQVANPGLQEIADINNAQIRTLASFSTNLSMQQSSLALPPQLETLAVANPRDTSAWGTGLGDRINWMINQKLNTATIRMDPPSLGRLEIHIQIADDVTNVTINTQHGQTRDMIDNASHRLREFLQENGYQNVNVDVSQQDQRQQASEQTGDHIDASGEGLAEDSTGNLADQDNRYFSSDSMVDYFA